MKWLKLGLLGLMGAFYILVGVRHFTNAEFFLKIMPPYIPWHRAAVYVSGAAEIMLGAGVLWPRTRRWAAWGLIALLIAVFPANIHAYQHQELIPAPAWAHLLRLPLQGVLIAWAWLYTRRERSTAT